MNRGVLPVAMKALFLGLPLLLILLAPTASARELPDPVEPSHQDVFLPEYMACLWKGSYKPLVSTPLVTIWHYTCDSRDT